MAGEYTVSGLAVPETIQLLHDLLAEARTDFPSVSEVDASMVETAVIEIAGNVVRHSPETETLVYRFTLKVLADRLVGVLEHSGPEVSGPPDPGMPEDLMAEGGRGLALADAAVHELTHAYVDGQNVWTLVRLRDGSAA